MILRNCVVSVILWIALVIGYTAFLQRRYVAWPFAGGAAAGTIAAFGLLLLHGSLYAFRDFGARNRLARGERPHDGDVVAAIGTIHPTSGAPLQSPLNGVSCVLYAYQIGAPDDDRNRGGVARAITGFGLTRCAIRTPYGDYALGAWPSLEGFPKRRGDRERAAELLRATPFKTFGFTAYGKAMMRLYATAPPLREDWRLSDAELDVTSAELLEQIVAPGETVTAFGRYASATNSIVSNTRTEGFVRLKAGGELRPPQTIPWEGLLKALGGLVALAIPNALIYLLLMR